VSRSGTLSGAPAPDDVPADLAASPAAEVLTPPEPRRSRSSGWIILLVVALVVIGLMVLAATKVHDTVTRTSTNDPRSTRPHGARAVAQLLTDQGVDLQSADQVAQASKVIDADSTLVIMNADRLRPASVNQLLARQPRRIVLVSPSPNALDALDLGLNLVGVAQGQRVPPQCSDPRATRAGAIVPATAAIYQFPSGATGCYPTGAGAAMVETTVNGIRFTILPDVISNSNLAADGNAALAMNVLGEHRTLVWLMARTENLGSGGPGTGPADGSPGLLPAWWPMMLLEILLVVVAVGLWRGRRLGPIIYEQLPVKILASETVEGHGRLYQRQQARGTAARALRRAALSRLSQRFGHGGDPMALIGLISTRTGRSPYHLHDLLLGPQPVTDQQLLDLKIALDTLEQEAHQP